MQQQGGTVFDAVLGDVWLRGEVLRLAAEYSVSGFTFETGASGLSRVRLLCRAFRDEVAPRFEEEAHRRVSFVLSLLVLEVTVPVDRAIARREGTLTCVGCGGRPDAPVPQYPGTRGGHAEGGCLSCGAPYVPGHLVDDDETEYCRWVYGWYEGDDGRYYTARPRGGGQPW